MMTLIVFISINIGIMNMLPFPALDGGRALITWIEGAFNKQLPEKVEGYINAIGFCCLIALMIFTTFNDLINIVFSKI
jgi:regulator of sigma E protease